jgi:hypothetical protein
LTHPFRMKRNNCSFASGSGHAHGFLVNLSFTHKGIMDRPRGA